MSSYFVTVSGQTSGPYTIGEIHEKIKQGVLPLSEYIFDPVKNEWLTLLDSNMVNPEYKKMDIPTGGVTKPNPNSTASDKWNELEWYLFKDNNQMGPYTYIEVVKMLQEKMIFDFDYVWASELDTWTKIYECPAFSAEQIKKMAQSVDPSIKSVFYRRQFLRAQYEVSLFVHNQKKLWKGKTFEISAGGCGFNIESNEVKPGDQIIMHFSHGDKTLPPFNALCLVVSKSPVTEKGKSWTRYGVKFEALNKDIQLNIRNYTEKAA